MTLPITDITAVILAGGQGRRMGGINKGLLPFHGRAMIQHVIDRLAPQVAGIVVSANQDLARYREFGYLVLSDRIGDHPGPLAGVSTALDEIETPWLACVPCDLPLLATDLIERLAKTDKQHRIRVAHDGHRQQSACFLLHRDLKSALEAYLQSGQHAVHRFLTQQHAVSVDFSDQPDAFTNINTPEELHAFD